MASFTADVTKEVFINAKIELNHVRESDYKGILDYISRVLEGKTESKVEEVPAEAEVKEITKNEHKGRYTVHVNEIESLFKSYSLQPKIYSLNEMTADDFARYYQISGVPNRSIGRSLTAACEKYSLPAPKRKHRMKANGKNYCGMHYQIPVLKVTYGTVIKRFRDNFGVNQQEFSEFIGYPVDVVNKWESGEATPSIDAISVIEKHFGKDIFCEVKKGA